MDKFSYTIMKEALAVDPTSVTEDAFEEALLTLGQEDLDEFFYTLNEGTYNEDCAKHVMALIQVLWHYR